MKKKTSVKQRVKEIQKFYSEIGLGTPEQRRYVSNFGSLESPLIKKPKPIFIEAGISSFGYEGDHSARLERNT